MRVEADKSTQHVAHETSRAACEEITHKRRVIVAKGGVLPYGQAYINGMRATGKIAYASVYEQGQMSEAGRVPKFAECYLESRLDVRVPVVDDYGNTVRHTRWVTEHGWGRNLSLKTARALAAGKPNMRVVVRNEAGEYVPDGQQGGERVVPKEQGPKKKRFW